MLEELIRVLFQVKSKAVAKLVINMPTDVSSIKPLPNGLARFLAGTRKSKKNSRQTYPVFPRLK